MDRAHVTVVEHPLVQHKLTLMRKVETSTNNFRRLLSELSALLAYEVLRDMPMHEVTIQTPLETMQSGPIEGKKGGVGPLPPGVLCAGGGPRSRTGCAGGAGRFFDVTKVKRRTACSCDRRALLLSRESSCRHH